MIKVDDLKKIVKLCLLSGKIKNMKPISLLVVAKAGSGKTELILSYKDKSLDIDTDLNYSKLIENLIANKLIKHIIIPDFIKITNKKSATSKNLISLFNNAIEEGIYKVAGFFKHDFKGRTIGLITSITPGSLGQVKTEWKNIGFIDRMIMCSYEYSQETLKKIREFIAYETEKSYQSEILKCPIKNKNGGIEIKSNYKFNSQLFEIAKTDLRLQKNLQRLLKCNALNDGRIEVNQKDVEDIKKLSKFLNLEKIKI